VVTHPRTVTDRPTSLLNPLMRAKANVFDLAEVTFGGGARYRVADGSVNVCGHTLVAGHQANLPQLRAAVRIIDFQG
jgi:hypothetical protein